MTELAVEKDAGPFCPVCGQALSYEGPGRWCCDICETAGAQGQTIEEVRADVEDLARGVTARFASAAGERCTCGAGPSCVPLVERGSGRPAGFITLEVEHAVGCPRSPGAFDWTPVNEKLRHLTEGGESHD